MADRKLTPKQEKFARLYVELGNASEAYRGAYDCSRMKPTTVNRAAKQLLDNPKIAARIQELRAAISERQDITEDDIVSDLKEDRELAYKTRKASAAVSATMGKAKILGLIVDHKKIQHSGAIGAEDPMMSAILDRLTDDELDELEVLNSRMEAIRAEIESEQSGDET